MSASYKYEQSMLGHDELEVIRVTHHPGIYDLSSADLHEARAQLRKMRDRERTLARQKRREVRGKAAPRGGSFPGTAERPLQRKQIFSAALKRINKELKRQQVLEARSAHVEAARRAFASRRSENFAPRPEAGETSGEGLRPLPSRRRRWKVPPQRIGSISQATKVSQALRDSKA